MSKNESRNSKKKSSHSQSNTVEEHTVVAVSEKDDAEHAALPQPIWRRNLTFFICCFAYFFDTFNSGGSVTTLNPVRDELHVETSTVQWVLTAYSLTYGSFLLTSGKLSDMYHPKPVFITGFLFVGLFSLGSGFVKTSVGLFVLRAFTGVGAALTIPSATHIIDSLFPNPKEKGIALFLWGGAGTLGSILGFVICGAIVQYASWRWVFWVISMGTTPVAILSMWVIKSDSSGAGKNKKLDIVGVFVLTAAVILIIFGLSEGPVVGWRTAEALAPLIISVFLFVAFFIWEAKIDQSYALIPASIWFIPNLIPLTILSFFTLIFFNDLFLMLNTYWGSVFGWNEFIIALHFLPLCIAGGIVAFCLGSPILKLPPKYVMAVGQFLAGLSTLLPIFAPGRNDYWRLHFPGMILIVLGTTSSYLVANVQIILSLPASAIGVGSAIFNAAAQIGLAVNVAIITSISTSIDGPVPTTYKGTRSALIYVVALGVVGAGVTLLLFNSKMEQGVVELREGEKEPTRGDVERQEDARPNEERTEAEERV